MSSNNMYRVGDFVYFESLAGVPYQIRKIEELNKTTTGAVEAKVICFYRRRDDPVHDLLPALKDQNYNLNETISEKQMHMLKHRELFLTRQLETLPATHIRGKANVSRLFKDDNVLDILNTENSFFYKYVYDSNQKTLHTGTNNIRIGSQYQAFVPEMNKEPTDSYYTKNREELKWVPDQCSDEIIDRFGIICCSIGTYARAVDPISIVRQPNLSSAVAAACRDKTLNFGLDLLHKANYDIGKAALSLCPGGNPMLVRDEMEYWSSDDAKIFEEGISKYGKIFDMIRDQMLPWKSTRKVVEFYYLWKTSEYYQSIKIKKKQEPEHKLKQVYIPNYTKPNPSVIYNESSLANANTGTNAGSGDGTTGSGGTINTTGVSTNQTSGAGCESCGSLTSDHWFLWGTMSLPFKLCESCWTYWKRYGGLKNPTTQDKQQKEFEMKSSSLSSATLPSNGVNPNSSILVNKSVATHLYQCPQIGCDKQFRQTNQIHAHITQSHPDIIPTLGENLMTTIEEFRNQKNGFVMNSSGELKISRRVMKSKIKNNLRLARCFKNRESRLQVAKKCWTRFQLQDEFNKIMSIKTHETIVNVVKNLNNQNNCLQNQTTEQFSATIDRIKNRKCTSSSNSMDTSEIVNDSK